MKLIWNIVLVGLVATVVTGLNCPADYFAADGGCFGVFDQPSAGQTNLEWPDARLLCQNQVDPGWSFDLATFDSTTQLEAVSEAWALLSDDSYPFMWVGIQRLQGTWQYVDGRPIPLTSNIWRETHPHNMNLYAYLDDVTLSTGQESYGRLYASCTSGSVHRRYMCRAIIL